MSFVASVQRRKADWIPHEEDRLDRIRLSVMNTKRTRQTHNVVSYDIMVSLLGKELDRESSHVSDSIRTAFFAAGCTQAEQNGCLLANSIQELGRGERRHIVCYFKLAPGASSLCMNNPGASHLVRV